MNTTDRLLRRVQRHAAFATVLRAEAAERPSTRPGDFLALALSSDELPAPDGQAAEGGPALPPVAPIEASPVALPVVAPVFSLSPRAISGGAEAPAPPAIPSPEADSEPDTTWRRLQTIFNRHKDKAVAPPETAEATDIEPADVPPNVDRMTHDRAGDPPQRAVRRDAASDSVEQTPQEQRGAPVVATTAPTVELPDEEAIPRSAVDSISLTGSDAPATHRVPLDKVWPVHKTRPPVPTDVEVQRAPAGQPRADALPPDESARYEAVQAALKNVAPQSPSDSQVELIPPRFPRPARAVSAPPDARSGAVPAQGLPPETESENTHPTGTLGASSPPATASAMREAADEGPIMTEIGPLPRDLWTLLGYTPPEAAAPSPPGIESAAPDEGKSLDAALVSAAVGQPAPPSLREETGRSLSLATAGTALGETAVPDFLMTPAREIQAREPAQAWGDADHAVRALLTDAPDIADVSTQRATRLASRPPVGALTPQPATAGFTMPVELPAPDERPTPWPAQALRAAPEQVGLSADGPAFELRGEEAAKPDIDELARRVYLDIKRRLVREWERARSQG